MHAGIPTLLGVASIALVSVTALSGQVPVDVPLPGTGIRLLDTTGPAGRRTYVALRDGDQAIPLPDPRVTGATAYIGRVGAGSVTVLDLPAADWGGSANGRADYKFKSRSGAIVQARILEGRSVRFSAFGDGAYPLEGTPQGGVGVIIDVGGVRFCGFFGGRIAKDDGTRFRARKAPPPTSCPILGTTTTTSTTTSTTTTTSSTTSTTSTTTTSTPPTTIIAVGFSESCECEFRDANGRRCGGFGSADGACPGDCPVDGQADCNARCQGSAPPDQCPPQTTVTPVYECDSMMCTLGG